MIIRLRVKNFLSFHDDEVEFCMIPGQGRLKQEHKSKPIGATANEVGDWNDVSYVIFYYSRT